MLLIASNLVDSIQVAITLNTKVKPSFLLFLQLTDQVTGYQRLLRVKDHHARQDTTDSGRYQCINPFSDEILVEK